ncbi:MAG: CopM family metallochaperone [Acidiphilium sp.]
MRFNRPVFAAALAGATLFAAVAFAQSNGTQPPAAVDQAFMHEMTTMRQSMSGATMTGKPDQDFVAMMIPHHQGAVAMAHTELTYGKSRYLKKMARRIIKSQDREIKEMQRWQKKHPNER